MTEQEKWDKVKKGLECCTTKKELYEGEKCYSCYRRKNNESFEGCIHGLMVDALDLLEAQEPRVMTLEEIKSAEVVWIEQVGVIVSAIKIRSLDEGKMMFAYNWDGDVGTVNISPKYYGKGTRCWTSRPTDEQRKAVKWK